MSEHKDITFESSLSIDEIERNFEGMDFFGGIMSGLNEALAYEKGKAKADTFARKRALPTVDVHRVRTELNMTQKAFARILGVSTRTVEAWECGRSTPAPTAKKLIHLIDRDHSIADRLSETA